MILNLPPNGTAGLARQLVENSVQTRSPAASQHQGYGFAGQQADKPVMSGVSIGAAPDCVNGIISSCT